MAANPEDQTDQPWDDDNLGWEPVKGRCNAYARHWPESPETYCMRDPGHQERHLNWDSEWPFEDGDWIRERPVDDPPRGRVGPAEERG